MEITKTVEGTLMTLTLTGELDTLAAPVLDAAVRESIDAVSDVVFDMTSLTYITSSGLRVMLFTQQEVEDRGKVIVRGANAIIKEIIEVIGFDSIFTFE